MRRHQAGFQLVELLVATTIIALAVGIGVPRLTRLAGGLTVRLAADEVVAALREARAFAILHSANVGVKFRTGADGRVTWALYRDGDGDGVRSNDIASGVDPLAATARELSNFGRLVRLGFPAGVVPRDPGSPRRKLDRLDDPIRFNRSDIASFSPVDGATPGSIYLTDGIERLLVVRIDSRSGRAHTLVWDRATGLWHD